MAITPPPVPGDVKRAKPPAATVQPKAPPPTASTPAPPDSETIPEVSFWQTPFAQNVLPFITSLVLHLSLILLAVLTVKAVEAVTRMKKVTEQVIVAEASMMDDPDGDPNGIINPGSGGDPTRPMFQDKYKDVDPSSKGIAEEKGPNLIPKMAGGGGGEGDDAAGAIAIGPGGALGSGGGLGLGKGKGMGAGDGDGTGVLAPFGIPGGGGGIGPRANFMGFKGNARRIAYVCDATGSMVSWFDDLRMELRKSIENLRVVQSFNVIFFQEQGFGCVERSSLMPANSDNKRKSYKFIEEFTPHGETNPLPALELAAAQKPELIYLLTDGDFSGPGNQAVIDFCKTKFSDGKTKINTIAFVSKQTAQTDAAQAEWVKALQLIATNSGGKFKFVSKEDMGQ